MDYNWENIPNAKKLVYKTLTNLTIEGWTEVGLVADLYKKTNVFQLAQLNLQDWMLMTASTIKLQDNNEIDIYSERYFIETLKLHGYISRIGK
jgi:hypothetical protein|tara:strand:- start:97 stop:375 length:279 start_codon:yes stop_codon:yes gene_type:complete